MVTWSWIIHVFLVICVSSPSLASERTALEIFYNQWKGIPFIYFSVQKEIFNNVHTLNTVSPENGGVDNSFKAKSTDS
jgi:hypothetical protein